MREGPLGPIVRECVEGYVFVRDPLRFLVLQRTPARGRLWGVVSGKVDPADPDYVAALRRELSEETGFSDPGAIVPLDWHVTFRADNGESWRLHAYAVELDTPRDPRLSREHEAFAWLSPAEAIGRLHYADNREAIRRAVARLRR